MQDYELFVYWGVRLGTLDPESKAVTKICCELYFKELPAQVQMKRGYVIEFKAPGAAPAQEIATQIFGDMKSGKIKSEFNSVLHDIEGELFLKGEHKILWEEHRRSKRASYLGS